MTEVSSDGSTARKALVALAIETVLLEIGKPTFQEVSKDAHTFTKIKITKIHVVHAGYNSICNTCCRIYWQGAAIVFTNWIFVPILGALVVLSILSVKRYGITGSHGKAWISFAIFSAM